MTTIALGLGSNKAFSNLRPEEILGGAVFEMSRFVSEIKYSSVYRTKAMYVADQDDFYNMALVGVTSDSFSARDLLNEIHRIETLFGRDREKEIRNGPRSLDIDIEFFGTQRIISCDLEIPHPRIKERAFVLIPLLEILQNSADNIKEKFFYFGKNELSASLASLGNTDSDVEIVLPKEDFSSFVKNQRCDYGGSGSSGCGAS